MEIILTVVFCILGAVIGLLVYILFKQSNKNDALSADLVTANTQVATAMAEVSALNARVDDKVKDVEKIQAEVSTVRCENTELNKLNAELKAQNENLREGVEAQKTEMERLQKEMKLQFEQIASEILESKSKKFTELNSSSLGEILKPLQGSIKDFQAKVENNLTEETKQRASMQEQVKILVEHTNSVSKQADNLASALKGSSKVRGNWGEMVLESVLQTAGILEGVGYDKQVNVRDEEGKASMPDIIVYLPNDKKLVIDSKVSLVAYERYSSSDDESEQALALKDHIASVKNHIDSLSGKAYNKRLDYSADFIMMFIPIEPAYMAAIRFDGELWQYAYKKGIMFVSPSNLLPCLNLINDMWKTELQNKNAKDIVTTAESLYEKLVGFVDSFNDVGSALKKAQDKFNQAEDRLARGKGNVFKRAEDLKRLGLKTQKQLPDN